MYMIGRKGGRLSKDLCIRGRPFLLQLVEESRMSLYSELENLTTVKGCATVVLKSI